MLELLILYILNKYDCTIYKIQKLIEEKFFIFSCPSLGAINPALKRLETLDCVEYKSEMSEGGKLSKIYKITPRGLKYLRETITLFDFKNQAYLLNNAKVCTALSDVLMPEQKEKFSFIVENRLQILKTDIENKLKNPYIQYS
ncbi:MAG: PadR family transcriptional regulator, partial [Candidatus Gastranaerophilales bacterium]|nr:PadR family transcriptional regulator [Candidatus Gastranaerophilales bacterium]